MANYKAYFEIPEKKEKRKFVKGSAPHLLDILLTELRGASEIEVSFFLYNNPHLHKFFEEESGKGCKITVITIPIAGYDSKLVRINANQLQSIDTSKRIYAEKILKRVQDGLSSIELRYYPHTNVWYRQETSRGSDSYALHNKSILAKFPDGNIKCISSSCNFALGDPLHSENILIVENCEYTTKMFTKYMELLRNNSLNIIEYYKFREHNQDFQFVTKPINLI
ncbi:hypothetical protein U5N28_19060, partial [Lysinibacillus telephonicus]|uniref:hypothetical protein n=1 Tax=Lysinibacillus telephonicus TaxID=1714840 RepID=UPI00397AD114